MGNVERLLFRGPESPQGREAKFASRESRHRGTGAELAPFVSEKLEECAKLVLLLCGTNPQHFTDKQVVEVIRSFQVPR